MNEFDFLYGNDRYLLLKAVQKIKSAWQGNIEHLNEINWSDFQSKWLSISFLNPTQLFVLENPQFDTWGEEQEKIIESGLSSKQALLWYQEKSPDFRTRIGKWLKQRGNVQHFAEPAEWDEEFFLKLIHERWKGFTFSKDLPFKLLQRVPAVSGQVDQEANKIAEAAGDSKLIHEKLLIDLIPHQEGRWTWLRDAVFAHDTQNLLQQLSSLLQTEPFIPLFYYLIAQYRLLIQILSMRREGMAVSGMATELGKNAYYLQRLLAQIPSKMNLELALSVYKQLAILDQKFKKGETSSQALLWIWEEI